MQRGVVEAERRGEARPQAGVPLVEALSSVAGATGNIIYEMAVLRMRDEVATGQRLQRAMENTELFPNMVNQMIAVGAEITADHFLPGQFVDVTGTSIGKGFQGAMPYSHDILAAMIWMLPPQSIFCVSGIGPAQLPATTQAILLGGHVRVGLEDNLYLDKGVLSPGNAPLVERAVKVIHSLGDEPATPAQAREILGI